MQAQWIHGVQNQLSAQGSSPSIEGMNSLTLYGIHIACLLLPG